jgi:hypothetical protein
MARRRCNGRPEFIDPIVNPNSSRSSRSITLCGQNHSAPPVQYPQVIHELHSPSPCFASSCPPKSRRRRLSSAIGLRPAARPRHPARVTECAPHRRRLSARARNGLRLAVRDPAAAANPLRADRGKRLTTSTPVCSLVVCTQCTFARWRRQRSQRRPPCVVHGAGAWLSTTYAPERRSPQCPGQASCAVPLLAYHRVGCVQALPLFHAKMATREVRRVARRETNASCGVFAERQIAAVRARAACSSSRLTAACTGMPSAVPPGPATDSSYSRRKPAPGARHTCTCATAALRMRRRHHAAFAADPGHDHGASPYADRTRLRAYRDIRQRVRDLFRFQSTHPDALPAVSAHKLNPGTTAAGCDGVTGGIRQPAAHRHRLPAVE